MSAAAATPMGVNVSGDSCSALSMSRNDMESEVSVDQKRSLSIVEEARNAARALVDRESRNGGRMVAYVRVAAMVGASEIWIRRFVNGYSDASPNLVVGFNILEQYRRIATKRE